MIDPKELRIGNWIKDFNDRYGLVTSFNQHRVWVRSGRLVNGYDCTLQDLYPIPLTEDTLIKCGFEWIGEDKSDRQFKYRINDIIVLYIVPGLSGAYLWYSSGGGETVLNEREYKYLHELQNLYYSLTSKEIEFKP